MILNRYILKEVFIIFTAVIAILVFIAATNQFVKLLAQSINGQTPFILLFKIISLYIPEFIVLLGPVSLFIAILLTLGRLYAENELPVLLTGGFTWNKILLVILQLASGLALIMLITAVFILPKIAKYREQLIANSYALGIIKSIVPGRFNIIENGKLVFYTAGINKAGDNKRDQLQQIFIASPLAGIITAKSATANWDQDNNYYIELQAGHRYLGQPGEGDYMVINFAKYGQQLAYHPASISGLVRLASTQELLKSNKAGDLAELQWRFALPMGVIILAILAISLAKVTPRQGKFAKFLPGVVVYMVYYNALIISRRFIANNTISAWPGLWGVNLIFLLIACFLYLNSCGYNWQLYHWLKKDENSG